MYDYNQTLAAFQGGNQIANSMRLRDLQMRAGQLAQGGNYEGAAQALLGGGDFQTGVPLLGAARQMGEYQQTREADKQFMKLWNGGQGQAQQPGTPAQSLSSLGQGGGAFPSSLVASESGGNWQAQNDARGAGGKVGHFGRLQFGQARLQEAQAAGVIPPGTTPQQFMQDPELQKRAEQWHFADIDGFIQQNGLDRAIGQRINGVPITVDGMRAVAHLGGKEGLRKFIASGGQYNPADRNGTTLLAYLQQHAGETARGGVQVANSEADVQRLEAQMAGQQPAPVQMAQAPGAMADVPAQGAQQPSQFAVPGQAAPQAPTLPPNDPFPNASTQQLYQALATPGLKPERASLIKAIIDRRNAFEGSRNPLDDQLKREQLTKVQRENRADPVAEATARADQMGLTGEDRKFYIANGRIPNASDKLTNDQANAGLYADRMRAANAIIAKPDIGNAAMGLGGSAQRLATDFLPGSVANNLVTSNFQQLDQAQRDFINAVLRRESGAAISPSEFDNARKQYFPQPGDAEAVLKQKAQNRQTAIDGISRAGGPAYAKDNPPGTTAENRAIKPTAELMKNAKRADDGKLYVPDPNRPGKFLRLDP